MRPNLILIFVVATECLLSIHAIANYRSLVPTRRFQSNRRYKDYRTPNRPTQQPNCQRYQAPRHHLIRPRAIEVTDSCVQVNQRQRREKKWHNIVEVKRDLENSPPPPSTTTPEPTTTSSEPPEPPKPKPKPQKGKKVKVEMVKITTILLNNQEMQHRQMGPPFMGPPPGYNNGPPPGYNGSPPGYNGPPPFMGPGYGPPSPLGPIPRWSQNQGSPPPWAYNEGRPAWSDEPPRRWSPPRARQKPKDALDKILSDADMKTKNGGSDEKWPLRGDSDRHRWESREGSDIYWELESTKKLATWDPNKSNGPLWKAASRSSSSVGKKKWEDSLDDFAELKDEWKDSEHGGVPKPPLQYLREYRRP